MVAQFADVSQFQPEHIDWDAYKAWSAQGDGVSHVAMRSTYGLGYVDTHFQTYREAALNAGIDSIIFYHYSYPQWNAAIQEANWQRQIVGDIRPQDMVILDFEENVNAATAQWAYTWLAAQEVNYSGKLPGIYASSAYISQRLSDPRLARYKLWLANWQFTPDERPPCPLPWSSYEFVQYTDRGVNIPGIASTVDVNIFLGKEPPMSQVPAGWSDDGTTLKSPDGTPVVLGFRDHILNNNWDASNVPLQPEQHLTVLEQSNPSLGGGQSQIFRMDRLEDTPKQGVFVGWIGQELLWYQERFTDLVAQVAVLRALNSSQGTQVSKLQTQNSLLQSQVADLQAQLAGNTLAQENQALLAKISQAQKDLS